MRVISGSLGGRKFYPPSKLPSRPTTDFAKTGLFNVLNNHFDFESVSVLDLFAGTGNISYEFASRGCPRIVSVDQDSDCTRFIIKMCQEWHVSGIEVIRQDVFRFVNHCSEQFDLIFAGPPYPLQGIARIPDLILAQNLLRPGGWFILETDPKYDFSSHPAFFRKTNYSQTNFHFFRNANPPV